MEFLVAAISLGFLGSFHCVGMCGPIALALPFGNQSPLRRVISRLVYNGGRIITYGILGLLFGMLGKGFIISGYQQALSIGLGVFILVATFMPQQYVARYGPGRYMLSLVSKLKAAIGKQFSKNSLPSVLSIGLLNGLLPCGLVYIAVAGAIATSTPIKGALFMMVFGLGTLPAMMLISLSTQFVSINFRSKIRKAVPVFVVIMAAMLILRGMNLGVPYISPKLDKADCTKQSCCHHKQP